MRTGPYEQYEIDILKEKFLLGWDDSHIAPEIDRSPKSVSSKRADLGYVVSNYPDRPLNPFGRNQPRTYTSEEDADIMARHRAKEQHAKIAERYNVSTRAITDKIYKLFEQMDDEPQRKPTPRTCLRCGETFLSVEPKSINRRCTSCQNAVRDQGTCIYTAYSASTVGIRI